MLIAERGGRTGVAGTRRELPGRCALRVSPGEPGAPQGVPAQPPSLLRSGQERGGRLGADEGPQVRLEARQDMRWDAHGPAMARSRVRQIP